MEVVDGTGDAATHDTLTLKWREVWWAESFGLPSISATFKWAILQAVEQAIFLLIPIGGNSARRTAGWHPPADNQPAPAPQPATPTPPQPSEQASAWLRTLLWLYDRFQVLWKTVQWLVMTPLALFVVLVMSVVRLLILVPFLRAGVITTISGMLDYIMLHWIAETEVYMLETTRAASIRGRFMAALDELRDDQQCQHIVVLAHSMGTVVAYEGLTEAFKTTSAPPHVTFICLAQAFRRMWLLATADFHRVREILPDDIDWLHFWARYDPVTAGPLDRTALPPFDDWPEAPGTNQYEGLCQRLDKCRNHKVVNFDSTFTDHGGYWQNLEEVVGPVAEQLMWGHEAIQHIVHGSQATDKQQLQRHASIAGRASLTLGGGFVAGLGIIAWAVTHPDFGNELVQLLAAIPWAAILALLIPGLQLPAPENVQNFQGLYTIGIENALWYLLVTYAPSFAVAGLAVLVTIAASLAIGRLVAPPSPFKQTRVFVEHVGNVGPLFVVCAVGIVFVFVASVLFHFVTPTAGLPNLTQPITDPFFLAYVWTLGIGELLFAVAYVITVAATILQRQWGWFAGVVIAVAMVQTYDPFYRSSLIGVALVGCYLATVRSARAGNWRQALVLMVIDALIVYSGAGAILFGHNTPLDDWLGGGTAVEFLLPMLFYSLWSGPLRWSANAATSPLQSTVGALAPICLLFIAPLASQYLLVPGTKHATFPVAGVHALSQLFGSTGFSQVTPFDIGVDIAALVAGAMVLLSLFDTVRRRRWGWLAALPPIFAALVGWQTLLLGWGIQSPLPNAGCAVAFFLAATALPYALWAGPPQTKSPQQRRGSS